MGAFGPATYAVFMLGDLGADVVRITPPPHPNRPKAGNAETDADGTPIPPGGVTWHRNKREMMLNLRTPEARELFYQLARQADVVVEANRPGVLDRLGIGYEKVREINPRIIYCSVIGYGQEGPFCMHPRHDACWSGRGGSLYLSGMSLGNLGNRRTRTFGIRASSAAFADILRSIRSSGRSPAPSSSQIDEATLRTDPEF